eukprot:scaffold376_cov454-Pavlova_lutheri.AAC.1
MNGELRCGMLGLLSSNLKQVLSHGRQPNSNVPDNLPNRTVLLLVAKFRWENGCLDTQDMFQSWDGIPMGKFSSDPRVDNLEWKPCGFWT